MKTIVGLLGMVFMSLLVLNSNWEMKKELDAARHSAKNATTCEPSDRDSEFVVVMDLGLMTKTDYKAGFLYGAMAALKATTKDGSPQRDHMTETLAALKRAWIPDSMGTMALPVYNPLMIPHEGEQVCMSKNLIVPCDEADLVVGP